MQAKKLAKLGLNTYTYFYSILFWFWLCRF